MKSGIKTSEFVLTLLAMLGGVLVYVLTNASPESKWIGHIAMVMGFLPAPVYVGGRAALKKEETKAEALKAMAASKPSAE